MVLRITRVIIMVLRLLVVLVVLVYGSSYDSDDSDTWIDFSWLPYIDANLVGTMTQQTDSSTTLEACLGAYSYSFSMQDCVIFGKVKYSDEFDEMAIEASAGDDIEVFGQYSVRPGRRGFATVSVTSNGSEFFTPMERPSWERFGSCALRGRTTCRRINKRCSLRVEGGKDTDWCEGVVV